MPDVGCRARPVRAEATGFDKEDSYAEGTHFLRQRLRDALDRELRRAVVPDRGEPIEPGDGSHIDDGSCTLTSHQRQHSVRHPHQSEEINLEEAADVVLVALFDP